MINRRRLLLAIAALAVPAAARAQVGRRVFRIAWVQSFDPAAHGWRSFIEAMRERGWVEGRDFVVEKRLGWPEQAEMLLQELLAAGNVDILLTTSTVWGIALRRATRALPIVMVSSGHPVEVGLAKSLARPGGNVTGQAIYGGVPFYSKHLELMRGVAPGMRQLGVLWDYGGPAFPDGANALEELERAARKATLSLSVRIISSAQDLEAALNAFEREPPQALFVASGPVNWTSRPRIARWAASRRLPSMSDIRWPDADPGLLLAYAVSVAELWRGAARYVDRILRGADPADLPIEQPTRMELVANLRTAKKLGMTIPQSVLARADRVIE